MMRAFLATVATTVLAKIDSVSTKPEALGLSRTFRSLLAAIIPMPNTRIGADAPVPSRLSQGAVAGAPLNLVARAHEHRARRSPSSPLSAGTHEA